MKNLKTYLTEREEAMSLQFGALYLKVGDNYLQGNQTALKSFLSSSIQGAYLLGIEEVKGEVSDIQTALHNGYWEIAYKKVNELLSRLETLSRGITSNENNI